MKSFYKIFFSLLVFFLLKSMPLLAQSKSETLKWIDEKMTLYGDGVRFVGLDEHVYNNKHEPVQMDYFQKSLYIIEDTIRLFVVFSFGEEENDGFYYYYSLDVCVNDIISVGYIEIADGYQFVLRTRGPKVLRTIIKNGLNKEIWSNASQPNRYDRIYEFRFAIKYGEKQLPQRLAKAFQNLISYNVKPELF